VLQPHVLNLSQVLTDMEAKLRRLVSKDIVLELLLAPELWPVCVDLAQIEQAIANLVTNAREAMPAGGALIVETDNVALESYYATRDAIMPPGEYVMLAVSDTGCGMGPDLLERIFEPFFTTKPVGHCQGLGLSMVYGLVRQSGGYVWVASQVEQGTTFRIYLPRAETAGPLPVALRAVEPAPRGAETVLVAEDDAAVRHLACDVLRQQGYGVLEAANGRDALRAAQDYRGPIHLLLSDVVMPGMSGQELADQMSRLYPGIQIILMSGYVADLTTPCGSPVPGIAFMPKPLSAINLTQTVRRLLNTTRT
jgi:two-component system cell cycle sensor histidine kinase/response regulator CckA